MSKRGRNLGKEKALEIRTLYAFECSTRDIARRYGVTTSAICNVVSGKTYRNVPQTWDILKKIWKEDYK